VELSTHLVYQCDMGTKVEVLCYWRFHIWFKTVTLICSPSLKNHALITVERNLLDTGKRNTSTQKVDWLSAIAKCSSSFESWTCEKVYSLWDSSRALPSQAVIAQVLLLCHRQMTKELIYICLPLSMWFLNPLTSRNIQLFTLGHRLIYVYGWALTFF